MTDKPDIIPDGLPDHLPDGERLIWQGKPDWKRLAIDAFHLHKIAIYFVVIIFGQAAWRLREDQTLPNAFANAPMLIALGAVACGILGLIAYLSARTTRYTLTSKRALLKIGIALPIHLNIPYAKVDSISFAKTGGDAGTICFKPGRDVRLAYLILWPHARPWLFANPQPAFRSIANVEDVATRLASLVGGHMPTDDVAESSRMQLVPAE